jgi:hypothetical protein
MSRTGLTKSVDRSIIHNPNALEQVVQRRDLGRRQLRERSLRDTSRNRDSRLEHRPTGCRQPVLDPPPVAGRTLDEPLLLETIRESAERLVALERTRGEVVRRGVGRLVDRAQGIPLRERRPHLTEGAVDRPMVAVLRAFEESGCRDGSCHGIHRISLRI